MWKKEAQILIPIQILLVCSSIFSFEVSEFIQKNLKRKTQSFWLVLKTSKTWNFEIWLKFHDKEDKLLRITKQRLYRMKGFLTV